MREMSSGNRMFTRPRALPGEFVFAVRQAFAAAEQAAGGSVDLDYRIGDCVVRLRFAGSTLVPALSAPLAHLEATGCAEADLTIHLWDTQSTGIGMPCLDVWNDCTERGAVRGFEGSGLSVTRLQMADVCSLLDAASGSAVYWAQSLGDIPAWERGAPFRAIFHAWWRNRGGLLLHAGAVGESGACALLIGRGGSGKSTTALACAQAGMQYLSDDYCLLIRRSTTIVNSLYCSAKLHAEDLHRFPSLAPLVSNFHELGAEKAICFLRHATGCRIGRSMDLRAILMPRVTGLPQTRLAPASPAEALQSLAPSAIFQLPEAGPLEFAGIAEIVKRAPCYWLECGTDIDRIPDSVIAATKQ